MLFRSIIAEYLGRIFEEVKQRPRYIVREIRNDRKSAGLHGLPGGEGAIKSTGQVVLNDQIPDRAIPSYRV